MINQHPQCTHPLTIKVNKDAIRPELIATFDQMWPGYPVDEVNEAIDSDTFAYARCATCRAILIRLAD